MEDIYIQELLKCVKILQHKSIAFPDQGTQNRHQLKKLDDDNEKFEMLINRKGHLNKDNLTYQMTSKTLKGILVRLDCSGAPHEDVPTPHIHIFDEEA